MRSKFLLLISHLGYGVLLQQLEHIFRKEEGSITRALSSTLHSGAKDTMSIPVTDSHVSSELDVIQVSDTTVCICKLNSK